MKLTLTQCQLQTLASFDDANAKRHTDTCKGPVVLDASACSRRALAKLADYLREQRGADQPDASRGLRLRILSWLQAGRDKAGLVSTRETLCTGIKEYLSRMPAPIVLRADPAENLMPWYVTSVEMGVQVSLHLAARVRGQRVNAMVALSDRYLGKTPAQALAVSGCYAVTKEMAAELDERDRLAARMEATPGTAVHMTESCLALDRTRSEPVDFLSVLVVDDSFETEPSFTKIEKLPTLVSSQFWTGRPGGAPVRPPRHPYVRVASLTRPWAALANPDSLRPKVYAPQALAGVVLPEKDRAFLEDLAKVGFRGLQAGGACSLVLLHGPPGTGKTRTASAFAEVAARPLCRVQCAQLGLNPAEVAARLDRVLERSCAWGAITLIDEASVYVSSRGRDTTQQALVDEVLQALDRHAGLVFITTNAEDIDPAVISRALASVKFSLPDSIRRREIVRMHADACGLALTEEDMQWLTEASEGYSGRSIERVLRLVSLVLPVSSRFESARQAITELWDYQ